MGCAKETRMLLLIAAGTLLLFAPVTAVLTLPARENIWITWAKRANVTQFCLSMQSAADPFRTCLIAVPISWPESDIRVPDFKGYVSLAADKMVTRGRSSCNYQDWPFSIGSEIQAVIVRALNVPSPTPLQELNILGSVQPGEWANVSTSQSPSTRRDPQWCLKVTGMQAVNGSGVFWLLSRLEYARMRSGVPLLDSQGPPRQNVSGTPMWGDIRTGAFVHWPPKDKDVLLPPGIFLICGDRAWPGIPKGAIGGPCYLGRLTLFAPGIRDFVSRKRTRVSRSLKEFDSKCKDNVKLINRAENIALSIFMPGASAAAANAQLSRLACWALKQFNLTSHILSSLLIDVRDVRHAVLQNRAAIDFSLLAHGHGCIDFEGVCCTNPSDHSQSIHKQLAELQESMHHITVHNDFFSAWLGKWNLPGWLEGLIIQGLTTLIALLLMIAILGCALKCASQIVKKTVAGIWVAQKQERGIVEMRQEIENILCNAEL